MITARRLVLIELTNGGQRIRATFGKVTLLAYIVSGTVVLISFAVAEAIAEWTITLLELLARPQSSMSSKATGIAYNQAMSERDDKRGGSGVAIGCGLVVFLLVVYLLSIGPAYRITGFQLNVFQSPSFSGYGQRVCEIVYWPICRACDHSDFIANSVSWYLGYWQ